NPLNGIESRNNSKNNTKYAKYLLYRSGNPLNGIERIASATVFKILSSSVHGIHQMELKGTVS
ncbi:hypothetical protein QPL79_08150, partial [Ignisphaera sp. 4213-co]